LSVNSATLYARYLRKKGIGRRRDLVRAGFYLALYRLGRLDIAKAAESAGSGIRGKSEEEVADFAERWYQEEIRQHIVPLICARLEEHRAAGHSIALLSSTTSYLAEPLSRDVNVQDLLVTRLEIRDGLFTGKAVPPICYGEGKIGYARDYLRERQIPLRNAYFYTDSITDLPLLELVGFPQVVAPDRLLRRKARSCGWPIIDP
jgi:HAD superfamily hydrolase (TIGR01490 family)